jgi:hypothetical protein
VDSFHALAQALHALGGGPLAALKDRGVEVGQGAGPAGGAEPA